MSLNFQLVIHLVTVVLVAVVVSAFVLRRVSTAVLEGMQLRSSAAFMVPEFLPSTRTDPLRLVEVEARTDASQNVLSRLQWERQARRHIAAAYLLSVAICGLLLSATWLWLGQIEINSSRLITITGVITSAAVPMVSVSLALPFGRSVLAWLSLVLVAASSTVVVPMILRVIRGEEFDPSLTMNAFYFLYFLITEVTVPFLLMFATGIRKLRGIAPLTLGLISILGLVPFTGTKGTELLRYNFIRTSANASAGIAFTGDIMIGMYLSFFLLAPAAGWLTWRMLRQIAEQFEKKRFSDAQLVAYSWWLIFVAIFASGLVNLGINPAWPLLLGTISFALFPVLTALFLGRARKHAEGRAKPMLLLLRVFGRGARSERFFDRVVGRWRLVGPVSVIAAPDIIARTVDPTDVLRLVSGQLTNNFVDSQVDLDKRLLELDLSPDPDGRYRVNEFWCRDNSWQATVVSMMARCAAVVVDVRGLTTGRSGLRFELEQLATRLPAERIVLVVDKDTDRTLIASAMAKGHGALKLVAVERNSVSETERVFEALLEASQTSSVSVKDEARLAVAYP